MKYTAEELYRYAEENEYVPALANAVEYNSYEFQLYKVAGTVTDLGNNNFRFTSKEQNKKDPEQLVLDCQFSNFPIERYPDSRNMLAYVTSFKGEIRLMGFVKDGEADEAVMKEVMIYFISCTKADTHGKLKKVLRDGVEVVQGPF